MTRLRWRHCILNARCSWLHGEKRGFRSRGHRIHSDGDYKDPPSPTEHAGLRAFHEKRSQSAARFDVDLRVVMLRHFIVKLRSLGYRVIAASLGEQHLHVLVELPWNLAEIRRIMGKCKQRVSHGVRDRLPGSIWSERGDYKWIRDKAHFHNVYGYIRTRQ